MKKGIIWSNMATWEKLLADFEGKIGIVTTDPSTWQRSWCKHRWNHWIIQRKRNVPIFDSFDWWNFVCYKYEWSWNQTISCVQYSCWPSWFWTGIEGHCTVWVLWLTKTSNFQGDSNEAGAILSTDICDDWLFFFMRTLIWQKMKLLKSEIVWSWIICKKELKP